MNSTKFKKDILICAMIIIIGLLASTFVLSFKDFYGIVIGKQCMKEARSDSYESLKLVYEASKKFTVEELKLQASLRDLYFKDCLLENGLFYRAN